MRKYNQKEKRNTIIWLCLLLALGLGIGYAVLTEQLKLNGSVNYGSMAWDVGFTTAEDGGGSITSSPTVSQDRKSVTVSCNVGTSTASETCIAKAKIKNASSFAVQLESNPTITFDNTYINSVDAVWTEDNSPITALNSISAGVEKEIQITITTKELTEDMLPETSLNIPVTITMDWVEIDDITSDDINEPSTSNILITNDDFTYGAYLNGSGSKNTSGAFGMLKTTDEMFRVQDITIEVIDTDVSNYIVVIEIYNEEGAYLGSLGSNVPLVEGSKTYALEDFINKSAESYYFRVNIGILNNGSYTKVPETAIINVYATSSVMEGKNIYMIGDSITYGAYLDDISTESYPKVLEQLTGSNVTVNAQSGIKLVGGITSKVANMTGSADLITIFGGTNDYWQGGISIGTYGTSDTTTFYGALQNILDNLESKYPDAEYLFIFPPEQKFNGATSGDKGYGSLDDFRSAFIDFCTRNNLKYIDLKTVSEFDYSKHTTDGVHPNKEGHIIIANAIFNFIQKNY
jgi:lysophospholipase L1-like esterase